MSDVATHDYHEYDSERGGYSPNDSIAKDGSDGRTKDDGNCLGCGCVIIFVVLLILLCYYLVKFVAG